MLAAAARAAPVRRVFQPTDLEFEEPGMAELDLQFGLVRGEDAFRISTPNFAFDVGLTPNLELDLDGEIAVAGPDDGAFRFDRRAPDNLWTALKIGLLDVRDGGTAWTVGGQLGPKLPVARGNSGVGVEGLALLGWRTDAAQLVLNLGGLLDPDPGPDAARPAGVEGGIDLLVPLDEAGRWSIDGQLSGVRYFSSDRDQIALGLGATWSILDTLDVSLLAFGGPLAGGDHWGVLLGFAPRVRLW